MVAWSRTVTFHHWFFCSALLPELLKRSTGSFLLGAFLGGSDPASDCLGAASLRHSHFDQEALAVIGPALRFQHIIGRPGLLRLQQFLQRRFVISERDAVVQRLAQVIYVGRDHVLVYKSFYRSQTTVQVQRGNDGLDTV